MNLPSALTQTVVNAQPSGEANTRLRGRWLILARAVWVVIAVSVLVLLAASIPAYFASLHVLCTADPVTCNNKGQMTPDFVRALQALGLSVDFFATYVIALVIIFAAVYTAIGAVIFWRKSDDRMALFASLTLVTFPAAYNVSILAALPAAWWLPSQVVILLGDSSLFLFFYLFPTGRFVPRWTRWLWIAATVFWAVNGLFTSLSFRSSIFWTLIFLGFICSIPVAQIYRYRRVSSAIHRQQTKWVIFGISIGFGSFLALRLLAALFPSLFPPGPLTDLSVSTAEVLFLLFVPLSIGVAILRSRLFDIDIIINRSLVYGLLSICVVGIYALVVVSLGTLLQASGNIFISLIATGLVAVLFHPLRTRLQRAVNRLMYGERDDPYRVISRLGEHLEATLVPDAILPTIVETVAQALKLPYVAIELQEEEQLRLVATYGTPVDPSLRIPLHYQQDTIGQLLLASRSPGESFTSADRRLLDDLARQTGVAAHAVRLSADLQRSRERVVLVREEERRHLARELHDSVSQALYGISLGTHTARTLLERDPRQAAEPLDYVLSLAEAALAEMRALIFELHPESLETEGLVSALDKQAAVLQARHGISVSLTLCEEPELPLQVKEDLYRIAQEALHNTVKHAHASNVDLRLDKTLHEVALEVRDDGSGFDASGSFPGHLGLRSMNERVSSMGGTLHLESAPGAGTTIRVRIPEHVGA